jgi:hypothetical protein
MLRENPVVKRVFAVGEAQVGKLVQQLSTNEKFVTMVQKIVGQSFKMKGTFDRNLQTALSAMNLPSMSDVRELKEKLEELRTAIDRIDAKVESLAGEGTKS